MKRLLSIIFFIIGGLGLLSVLQSIGDPGQSSEVHKQRLLFSAIFSFVFIIVGFVLRKSGNKNIVAIKSENFRDFIELTPEAVELAKNTILEHKYPSDTALRIIKQDEPAPTLEVKFDMLSDDDRDRVGESSGLFVMIDKNIAFQLEKLTIDAKNGEFICSMQQKSN